jgi:hypothetical protein
LDILLNKVSVDRDRRGRASACRANHLSARIDHVACRPDPGGAGSTSGIDELEGAERISAEDAIRTARAARATLVRPAPDRVARKKNETPRVAGLS